MFPEPRIVGGSKASFGRWPWQISLRQWRTSTYLHKCGSALLNENWAISAAHCVDKWVRHARLIAIDAFGSYEIPGQRASMALVLVNLFMCPSWSDIWIRKLDFHGMFAVSRSNSMWISKYTTDLLSSRLKFMKFSKLTQCWKLTAWSFSYTTVMKASSRREHKKPLFPSLKSFTSHIPLF